MLFPPAFCEYIVYCRPPFRESDEHSISGVLIVCGAWFCSGAMCVQLLLQFKCIDRFETWHCLQIIQVRKWFIYNIQSH